MYFTDDPVADFERYDAEKEAALERLPKCDECKKRIQDDYVYEIEGYLLCESCMKANYRKDVDEYIY